MVTWNLADFPATFLGRQGLSVSTPDAYLCSLLSRSPREVTDVLVRMAAGRRRPPMAPLDIVGVLDRAGVPVFARRARRRLTEGEV